MRLRVLAISLRYQVLAVINGDECPVLDFLTEDDVSTVGVRLGYVRFFEHIVTNGLGSMPPGWSHEANKQNGIFEFRKGDFRILYFKGIGNQVAICAVVNRKSSAKVNKQAVHASIAWKMRYQAAHAAGQIILVSDNETD
ncbi:MAG: hypothetical protein WCP99_16810 [Burkholderiales bacterium]